MAGNSGARTFRIRAKNRQFEGFDQEHEGQWRGPFTFIASADTQYGMIAAWDDPTILDWTPESKLARQAIERINMMRPRPRFVAILGDLIDSMPGRPGHEDQKDSIRQDFLTLDPDIPLVPLPGNHDIGNTPSTEDIRSYTGAFGDDFYAFWVGGVRFIVLNSQLYTDSSRCKAEKEEQDAWLDKQLQDVKNSDCKHVVVFQHIPLFLKTAEEENEYFNTDVRIRMPMLDKLQEAGVRIIFCGHYHRNAGGVYKGMEEVVASAWGMPLGTDKSGLCVVKVEEDAITHQFHAVDDIPLET